MREIGPASIDQIMQAYHDDAKVLELKEPWPALPSERVALVKRSGRPVDRILGLAWKLCVLEMDEFLKIVYAVWSPCPAIHVLSFGAMLADVGKTWCPEEAKWKNVEKMTEEFKANPPKQWGPFIAYEMSPSKIDLEDGHTRLTAAHLAGRFPSEISLYIGVRTDR